MFLIWFSQLYMKKKMKKLLASFIMVCSVCIASSQQVTFASVAERGLLSIETASKVQRLKVRHCDSCLIVGYVVNWVQNGEIRQLVCTSEYFTDEIREMIRKRNSGESIYFEKIEIKNADGEIIELPSLVITIR